VNERFTRFWARLLVVLGLIIVVLGVLLAVVALVIETPWASITGQVVLERVVVSAFLVISGVVGGAPFIVLGQLLLIFLDQRRLLVSIKRRLRHLRPRSP
jgi:hypothetical protein